MNELLLGLDIGTSSVKGVVCNLNGRVITHAEAANQLDSPHHGWAEQSVERWKTNTIQVIRECLQQPDVKSNHIICVGVSGMVPAMVIMDAQANILRPAIQYNDARAATEIQDSTSHIGADRFFQITGARLSAQSIGPKWSWLGKHEPDIQQKTATLMGSYDTINSFLTGSRVVERNWALESGLYDLQAESWSEELLKSFKIKPDQLPQIRQPTDIIGRIRHEAAIQTGLMEGTPVIAGSADHVAAAFAAGINQQGDVLIKFGSSGDILYCSEDLIIDPRLYIDYHVLPGKYLPNGCMATSGSLLKWVVETFCSADQAKADESGMSIYEYLDLQGKDIPPGSDGIVILPYFLGAKTPINEPRARGTIFGLTLSHHRSHLYRAVMESVVFGFRDHFEVLNTLGLPIRRVIASEGGARSPLWRQIAADVLNQPISYLKNNPGSAYGAAILAGIGAGADLSWDRLEQDNQWGQPMAPDPHSHTVYQSQYEIYQELYPQIQPFFERLL